MAVKAKGLGKGIDSLIPNTTRKNSSSKANQQENESGVILNLKLSDISPNKEQPRKNFEEDSLIELSESIKQCGVISPILVKKKDDYYEIITGERRWRAAKIAGLKEMPAIINNDFTEQEILEVSIIENIQREQLNPIEEGLAYKKLIEEFKLKQDEVAQRVSKSRAEITNKMRLLKLDERVQNMIVSEMISSGHGRALLGFSNLDEQYDAAMKAFDEKLSVRDIEKMVKAAGKQKTKKQKASLDEQYQLICQQASEKMSNKMGTKVNINQKEKGKGKIEIEFYSQEELDRIMDLILSLNEF